METLVLLVAAVAVQGASLGGYHHHLDSPAHHLHDERALTPSNVNIQYSPSPQRGHTVQYGPWPYSTPEEPPETNVYLFVGPPEPEQPRVTYVVEPPPKNRVKIIFIKVPPTQPQVLKELILPQKINEKTLVYVLVKKPEDPPPIVIPRTAPAPPVKPEVFIIKYDSEKQLNGGVGVAGAAVFGETPKTEDEVNSDLLRAGGIGGERQVQLPEQ